MIRNEDWGISYAFSPILSYMGSAVLVKAVSLFTADAFVKLAAARFMNVLLGTLMAWIVLKTGKLLFPDRYAWMFSFAVAFLPGNVILYSYVNCDALAMCSTAIIFYAWARVRKEGWTWLVCTIAAVGMGLCFLSYYNAYGYILMTFFFFVFWMLFADQTKPYAERWKEMLKKGIFILCIVSIIALWWFVRNAMLYHGDILGRSTSRICAEMYAKDGFKPSQMPTFQNQNRSILSMIFHRTETMEYNWLLTVMRSFVGAFGYNKFYLAEWMNILCLGWIISGVVFMLCFRIRDFQISRRKGNRLGLFSWAAAFAVMIPNVLNIYYSYSTDFQPQGRYSMPMLLPLMYFVVCGVQSLVQKIKMLKKAEKMICIVTCLIAVFFAVYAWLWIIYPLYQQNYYGLR